MASTGSGGPSTLVASTGGGSTTLERPKTTPEKKVKKSGARANAGDWEIRLYNDPMNKREYVARCLMETCGLSEGQAFQVMMSAHQNGAAVVGRYAFEQAELYYQSLRGAGLTVDMVKVGDD
jgi:ATP-dependent Clp protease adapter protein ClpS